MSDLLRRIGVFVAVVLAVTVAVATAAAMLAPSSAPVDDTSGPAYDFDAIHSEPVPAEGDVSVDVDGEGTILIDDDHDNDFESEDVAVFASALIQDGHEVDRYQGGGSLEARLSNASAYVVIAPQREFDDDEVDAIEEFVEGDGRLLIVGEPMQGEVQQADLFAVQLQTVRSEANSLASRFGMQFGDHYLYNLEESDGNYRNVFAESTEESGVPDVERTAMYTATHVESPTATELLVTVDGTENAIDDSGEYAVALRDGSVVAVGDADFMSGETYNVADNDAFLEAIITFLLTGSFDGDDVAPVDYDPDIDEEDDLEGPEDDEEDEEETEEVDIGDPTDDDDEPDDEDDIDDEDDDGDDVDDDDPDGPGDDGTEE